MTATKKRPKVYIEAAQCSLCGPQGKPIVTGSIAGRAVGLRLQGCKATFGIGWHRVPEPEKTYWVKRFWEIYDETY